MSTAVESQTFYYGVCSECGDESKTYAFEEEAEAWAATHDAENHGDNGTNDDDYERFKEARGEQ